jgi:hypothetical protein
MRYRTKAEWAEAKAAEMEACATETARDVRSEPYTSARRYARGMGARDHFLREAVRYRRLAERFAASGQ